MITVSPGPLEQPSPGPESNCFPPSAAGLTQLQQLCQQHRARQVFLKWRFHPVNDEEAVWFRCMGQHNYFNNTWWSIGWWLRVGWVTSSAVTGYKQTEESWLSAKCSMICLKILQYSYNFKLSFEFPESSLNSHCFTFWKLLKTTFLFLISSVFDRPNVAKAAIQTVL